MNPRKIGTLIRKEWAEVFFRNRMVLFTVIFLPLMMTVLPLGIFYAGGGEGLNSVQNLNMDELSALCSGDLNSAECGAYFILSQFLLMFMLTPLAIPATFAAYSVVGEKTTRSLEPLLAAPITTAELLAGKSLAAVIPAVLATWGGFLLFLGGLNFVPDGTLLIRLTLSPLWMLAVFLLGPLMAVMSVLVSLMVSSRANDPRAAEQISMVIILPLLGVLFAQLGGFLVLNSALVTWAAVVLMVLDAVLFGLAGYIFERETILTRWK